MLRKLGIEASCDGADCDEEITVGAEKDLGALGWHVVSDGDTKLAFCSLKCTKSWVTERLAPSELSFGRG